eukprot:435859_1
MFDELLAFSVILYLSHGTPECDSFHFDNVPHIGYPTNVCIIRDHGPISQSMKAVCDANGDVELYVYNNDLNCSGEITSIQTPCYFLHNEDSDCTYTPSCNLGPCNYTSIHHFNGVSQCNNGIDVPDTYENYTHFPVVGHCYSLDEEGMALKFTCDSELSSLSITGFMSSDCDSTGESFDIANTTIAETGCDETESTVQIVECNLVAPAQSPAQSPTAHPTASNECDSFYFDHASYMAFATNVCIVRDHAPVTLSMKGLCNTNGEVELYIYNGNLDCSGTATVESPCYFSDDEECAFTSNCNLGPCTYTSYQHFNGVTQCNNGNVDAYANYTHFPLVLGGCGSVEGAYSMRLSCNSELNAVSAASFLSTDCSGTAAFTGTLFEETCDLEEGEAEIVECDLVAPVASAVPTPSEQPTAPSRETNEASAVPAPSEQPTAAAVPFSISSICISVVLHFLVLIF